MMKTGKKESIIIFHIFSKKMVLKEVFMKSFYRWVSQFYKKVILAGIFYPVFCNLALANAAQGMPWVSPLQKIQSAISGPVAQAAGVICIVIAGLGIAFGESGGGVKRLFQVVMGLAIAFTAASIVSQLFGGGASGAVF